MKVLLIAIDQNSQDASVVEVSSSDQIPVVDDEDRTVIAAIVVPDGITWCMVADLDRSRGEEYIAPMYVVPATEEDRKRAPKPMGLI